MKQLIEKIKNWYTEKKTCKCCLKTKCTNSCKKNWCDGPDECRGLIERQEWRDYKGQNYWD